MAIVNQLTSSKRYEIPGIMPAGKQANRLNDILEAIKIAYPDVKLDLLRKKISLILVAADAVKNAVEAGGQVNPAAIGLECPRPEGDTYGVFAYPILLGFA